MGYDPQKLIDAALAEVGYLEKETNAELDDKTANAGDRNFTKYGRDLQKLQFYNGNKNGVAWCDVFVDWCFVKAYGKEAALKLTYQPTNAGSNCGAGCKYSRRYFKNAGRLFDKPETGDQIFFYPADGIGGDAIQHTGIVYGADDTYVYTIEGNTSSASGVVANGGAVAKKKYRLDYNRLAGYGRPIWDTEPAAWEKTLTITCPEGAKVNLRKGNGTEFAAIDSVENGTRMEWIATAANGWHAGVYGDQVVWVTGEYSKVV